MDDFTIISYPAPKDTSLLSLTEDRSRYMLPFGGRFRVIDFTLRNSLASGARHTIIYSNFEDGLDRYVENYGPFTGEGFPAIKVVNLDLADLRSCQELIAQTNTRYYIIYNGDSPSLIDFSAIAKKVREKKIKALLLGLNVNDRASLAYKMLVADRKSLQSVLARAIKEGRSVPNLFEMVINMMIHRGVNRGSFHARYWPIRNIPEYYQLNRSVIWDPEISSMLFDEHLIRSYVRTGRYALVGQKGKIATSFIADGCTINGTVENSIIYPGVEIDEGSIVKDSIILPFVKIGRNARITRAIIDERTLFGPENAYPNVGDVCTVGTEEENIKNNDFPRSLFSGITLIGKDTRIVEGARIGGACYVATGLGVEYFTRQKYLHDGLSVVS